MRQHLIIAIGLLLAVLPLHAQYRDDQFKRDAFTQTYADSTQANVRDTSSLFSFKAFFGGLAHKQTTSLKDLTVGSAVFIGGNQIYQKQYWKLPIFYGGVVGCIYAMTWNNQMYHDYAQAYMDIMDNNDATQSYNQFLHLGNKITEENKARYTQLFKKRKDRYRRWRDLSFFSMVGIYALSVIDAYVDAELSDFDISKDLSMKVRPTVFGTSVNTAHNTFYNTSVGVNCSLNF